MHFFNSKQNGHPVTPKCIEFNGKEKTYTKEACDVRTDYSILFPLSSNQNYQSTGFARCQRGAHPSSTRQTLFADLSMLRPKGLRHPQLDAAHDSRFEPGQRQNLGYGLSKKEASAIVDLFFESMSEALVKGDRVEIRGLCAFFVKEYKSYQGRNPNAGEIVQVAPKKLPFFKCGKELKERGGINFP